LKTTNKSAKFETLKGGHGSAKWTQTSLICELGTWVYLKGYDLENLKKYIIASF